MEECWGDDDGFAAGPTDITSAPAGHVGEVTLTLQSIASLLGVAVSLCVEVVVKEGEEEEEENNEEEENEEDEVEEEVVEEEEEEMEGVWRRDDGLAVGTIQHCTSAFACTLAFLTTSLLSLPSSNLARG